MSDDEAYPDERDDAALILGAKLSREPWLVTRALRRLRREIKGNRPRPYEVVQLDLPADVIVYFGDDRSRFYQLEQWLPALQRLNERHRVVLVLRQSATVRALEGLTTLPVVFIRTLRQLMDLYSAHEYKVAIYVNHSRTNFQSLMGADLLHVHVNHGESDKRSSFSNQVRGYNRVFVAGHNAAERYREALLDLPPGLIVEIGRPQLDTEFPPVLPASARPTLLYAPTWEGETEDNNWTSVDLYGRDVVRAMLAVPGARVIYKPHPRVATTTSSSVAAAHRDIEAMLERSGAGDPTAGHGTVQGEILALLPQVDAMVSDVSTVALDFLYLRPESPLFLTDRRSDREQLHDDTPLSLGVDVIDAANVAGFADLLRSRLADDVRREDRERLRGYYFGDLHRGESTQRFLDAISELCDERDRLIAARQSLVDRSSADRAIFLGGH